MKVKIQSIHFDADEKLLNFVEEKVGKLNTFSNAIIDGEVFLRLDKSSSAENKIAEIKLLIPGNDLFAKRQCKTFEEATDQAIEALRRQLKKQKEKSMP
ncbi:MAG: ribosome-associated translation inhibitor RaiA [Flavobacteriales bacterium]|jgi:putative sigma-54 modulation protein|nr:ribosome-associated translation inhibitor RaiA [Flavobacteriales bacterium]